MKIAIITSILGDAGKLHDPEKVFDADYYAFVDREYQSKVWKQLPAMDFSIDDKRFKNRRNAKIYKVAPHLFLQGYDYYIWVDATHEVIQDPNNFCSQFMSEEECVIGTFKHTDRNCVYDESQEILKLEYDRVLLVESQMKFYRSVNYPEKNGLYELPTFILKNSKRTQTMSLR